MPRLHGAAFHIRPFEEANCEAVLTAADLRKQRSIVPQADAEQPAIGVFLHAVLVHAVNGALVLWLSTLTNQPEKFSDGITDRANCRDPFLHILGAPGERLPQPVAVNGKVEFAGTTRDRTAVLDRVEKVTVLERLQERGSHAAQFVATLGEVVHQHVEAFIVNPRLALKALQNVELMVQFLVNVAADVAAGQDCQHVEEAGDSRACRPVSFLLAIVEHLLVEKLQPQERAHTLRERLLIVSDGHGFVSRDMVGGLGHPDILRHAAMRWQIRRTSVCEWIGIGKLCGGLKCPAIWISVNTIYAFESVQVAWRCISTDSRRSLDCCFGRSGLRVLARA